MSEPLVRLEKISCKVGSEYTLRDINWEISRGQRWLLFGRNGCGKTTLLAVLNEFLKPKKGSIHWEEWENGEEGLPERRLGISLCSMSIQEKFYHRETALEIILGGLCGCLGTDGEFTAAQVRRIKAWFRYFGVLDKLNLPFDMLSKGERQIVLLVRTFMSPAQMWLLDEPSEGLDVVMRRKLSHVLRNVVQDETKTLVLVTHNFDPLLASFTHALVLKKGKVVSSGAIHDAFTSETVSNIFGEELLVSWKDGVPDISLPDDTGKEEAKAILNVG